MDRKNEESDTERAVGGGSGKALTQVSASMRSEPVDESGSALSSLFTMKQGAPQSEGNNGDGLSKEDVPGGHLSRLGDSRYSSQSSAPNSHENNELPPGLTASELFDMIQVAVDSKLSQILERTNQSGKDLNNWNYDVDHSHDVHDSPIMQAEKRAMKQHIQAQNILGHLSFKSSNGLEEEEEEEENVPLRHMQSSMDVDGGVRSYMEFPLSPTGSSSSKSMEDIGMKSSKVSNMPLHMQLQQERRMEEAIESYTGENGFEFQGCDPRLWIVAAGELEKKRDGKLRDGWAKRFFVLTHRTLYYFLVPRRDSKGEPIGLIGEERGSIRLSDIQDVTTGAGSDGWYISMNLSQGVTKRPMTFQNSSMTMILRASEREIGESWAKALQMTRNQVMGLGSFSGNSFGSMRSTFSPVLVGSDSTPQRSSKSGSLNVSASISGIGLVNRAPSPLPGSVQASQPLLQAPPLLRMTSEPGPDLHLKEGAFSDTSSSFKEKKTKSNWRGKKQRTASGATAASKSMVDGSDTRDVDSSSQVSEPVSDILLKEDLDGEMNKTGVLSAPTHVLVPPAEARALIENALKIPPVRLTNEAFHINPLFAIGALIALNASCYMGYEMNSLGVWVVLNTVFVVFLWHYEALAGEYDSAVRRSKQTILSYRSAVESVKGCFDRFKMYDIAEDEFEDLDEQEIERSISTLEERKIRKHSSLMSFASAESSSLNQVDETLTVIETKQLSSPPTSELELLPSPPSIKTKLPPGTTTNIGKQEDWLPLTWENGDGTIYRVRKGPNYKANKQKDHSKSALYDMVAFDVVRGDKMISSIVDVFELPSPRDCDDIDAIKKCGLPRILIVNLQMPIKPPSMFGNPKEDPGVSVVFYFALKPETVQAALDLGKRKQTPQIDLLHRFYTEWDSNEDIRRRFKGIGVCSNLKELGAMMNNFAGYNGKPVILYKCATPRSGPDYLEINVCIHKFGFIPRRAMYAFKDRASECQIRPAFVIQAEDDSEMPECILACGKLHNLDFDRAVHIDDILNRD